MLILDYQRWMHHDIPQAFYQYKDDSCPCLNLPCLITPNCSMECKPFLEFVKNRVSEALSFMRSHMTTNDYYKKIENDDAVLTALDLTCGLIHLYNNEYYQNKIPREELEIIFSRYIYCMHRAQAICNNRKIKNPESFGPGDFYMDV